MFMLIIEYQRPVWKETQIDWYGKFLPVLGAIYMLLIHHIAQELMQLQRIGIRAYFTSFWDLVDLLYLIPSTVFFIVYYSKDDDWIFDRNTRPIILGYIALLLSLKVLGFLRLLDKTSFYLSLIQNTIRGTGQFLIIWIGAIMVVGFLPHYLNIVRVKTSSDDFIFDADTQMWTNS